MNFQLKLRKVNSSRYRKKNYFTRDSCGLIIPVVKVTVYFERHTININPRFLKQLLIITLVVTLNSNFYCNNFDVCIVQNKDVNLSKDIEIYGKRTREGPWFCVASIPLQTMPSIRNFIYDP